MSRNGRRFGWDWSGLMKHVDELVEEIAIAGEAVDDLYMLWNYYGPGTYNRRFLRLTKNALLRAFELRGIPRQRVKVQHGKNGKVVVSVVGGDVNGHKA